MTQPWEDPRVQTGLPRQLAARRRLLDAGSRPVGWKVGFGAPASLELMEISAPLVGFLTDATLLANGAAVATDGWERGIVEFEVAVHLGADVPGGASQDEAASAVSAVAAAIELANIDLPLAADGVADIVAGNIFHEGVILGAADTSRAGLVTQGLVARVLVDDEERHAITDLEANTGPYPWIVATVAATLAANGERLSAGDVIITGSVCPPIPIGEGSEFTFVLDPLDPISVVTS